MKIRLCRLGNQRAADTGWGAEEDRRSRWAQDKFEGSVSDRRAGRSNHTSGSAHHESRKINDKDSQYLRAKGTEADRDYERRVDKGQLEQKHKDVHDSSTTVKRSRACYTEQNSTEERDWSNEKRSRKYKSGSYQYGRERSCRTSRDRDTSPPSSYER